MRSLRALAAGGILAAVGCATEASHLEDLARRYESRQRVQPAMEEAVERKYGLELLGDHTPDHVYALNTVLGRLTPELVAPAERLYLIRRDSLYRGKEYLGEAHGCRSCCLALAELDDDTVAHELAHQWHFRRESAGGSFNDRWDAILARRGTTYRGKNDSAWEDGYKGPRQGFISAYAASDRYESVASMVEAVYAVNHNKDYALGKCLIPWLLLVAPEDRQAIHDQLDLLLDEKAISKEDHAYAKAKTGAAHGQYRHLLNDQFWKILDNPFGNRAKDP